VWTDERDGNREICRQRIGGTGASGGSAVSGVSVSASSGSATSPSLTTTGAEVRLAWRDTRHGGGDLYARRLGYDGTSRSGEVRLTADGLVGSAVSASWHGSGFGVAQRSGSGPRLSRRDANRGDGRMEGGRRSCGGIWGFPFRLDQKPRARECAARASRWNSRTHRNFGLVRGASPPHRSRHLEGSTA
jgi:hypothetical protein